jgi:hypothetical protein
MIDVGGMRAASHSSHASAGEISGSFAASCAIERCRSDDADCDDCDDDSWSEAAVCAPPAATGECEVDEEVDGDGDDVSDAEGDAVDEEEDDAVEPCDDDEDGEEEPTDTG